MIPYSSLFATRRMAGLGASSSLPNAPAKVPLLCDLPTFVMVDWGARALPWRAA